jgi:hypothetical protein
MSAGLPPNLSSDEVRCPTCDAVQEWSDACRRCRCDLTLLRQLTASASTSRHRCLRALRDGRLADALRHARRFHALSPGPTATRLLAVCHLLRGDWFSAAAYARLDVSERDDG